MPAAPPAPVQAFAPDFARRLGLILTTLAALIARRFPLSPRLVPLIIPLWRRLTRAARRFERLMARLAAGRLPRPHRSGSRGPHPATAVLPRGRLWLIAVLGSEAAACATQLQALLAEPAAAGLLAAVPAARRIVLPLGRLLGLPACAPVRRPRAPRPARPRPPPLPPIRPTSPYPSAKWPWLDRSFRKRD
jgi:hypothetical protein